MNDLTFRRLREINDRRAQHWHGDKVWSLSDWMTALVGEVGEAANVIKKLNRIRDGLPGNKEGVTETSLRTDLVAELAEATRAKFNEVSKRLGFEERL